MRTGEDLTKTQGPVNGTRTEGTEEVFIYRYVIKGFNKLSHYRKYNEKNSVTISDLQGFTRIEYHEIIESLKKVSWGISFL